MNTPSIPSEKNPVRHEHDAATRIPRILVVDDEEDLRELIGITLLRMGFDHDSVGSMGEAIALLEKQSYQLCLTDMRLRSESGLDLVKHIQDSYTELPIAVITAFGSAENAVAALKAGAFDYVSKPLSPEALRTLVLTGLRLSQSAQAVQATSTEPLTMAATPSSLASMATQLMGQSAAIQQVRDTIYKLTRSMASVVIQGESGCGKELAARLIHSHSPRAAGPFIAVNCGALPEALMESEFFGHKKGAFTGADTEHDGFFRAAHGGTLFLDEIADLPLLMQVKLLRAIQEKSVRKVGMTQEEPVDVRIISATHQNLAQCVAQGKFRQDLFYRLNVIELHMPPVRERPEDVPCLVEHMIKRLTQDASRVDESCAHGQTTPITVSPEAMQRLVGYAFPGNVREMENILERALAFSNHGQITVEDLGLPNESMPTLDEGLRHDAPFFFSPEMSVPKTLPRNLATYLAQVEHQLIGRALQQTQDNHSAAAQLLGISFRALRYRMHLLRLGE